MTSYAGVQQLFNHHLCGDKPQTVGSCVLLLGKKQVSSQDIYRNIMHRKVESNWCWLGQKGRASITIVLTLFHTAVKKKVERHRIKSTTHEITEAASQLHEKFVCSILGQEIIRLWGVSFYHKGLKGGLSLESTLTTSHSRNLHCPLSVQGYTRQTVS